MATVVSITLLPVDAKDGDLGDPRGAIAPALASVAGLAPRLSSRKVSCAHCGLQLVAAAPAGAASDARDVRPDSPRGT